MLKRKRKFILKKIKKTLQSRLYLYKEMEVHEIYSKMFFSSNSVNNLHAHK